MSPHYEPHETRGCHRRQGAAVHRRRNFSRACAMTAEVYIYGERVADVTASGVPQYGALDRQAL